MKKKIIISQKIKKLNITGLADAIIETLLDKLHKTPPLAMLIVCYSIASNSA